MLDLPDVTDMIVCADTETSGLFCDDGARLSIVSTCWREGGVLVTRAYPFDQGACDKPGQQPSMLDPDVNLPMEAWNELMGWLSKQRLVWHNAYFDTLIMGAGHRVYGHGVDLLPNTWWDTKLAAWVMDPLLPSSLKPTAARLWGDEQKAEQEAIQPLLKKTKPRNRFDLLPWEVVAPYAAKDAELTYKLLEYQVDRLEQDPWLMPQVDQELAVMKSLVRMNRRGIGYWVERSRIEAAKARALMIKIDQELPFSPATPVQARKYFFDTMHALPHCKTDKGGLPSVGECCVNSLIQQQVPGADEWATRTKLTNAIGKYYDGYADATGPDGRLRTNFKQAGTVTMRFASERVNLQALPHEHKLERLQGIVPVRDLFMPAQGHELWEFDIAQAEARVAAKVAGCDTWLAMFEDGRDLHAETADRLFGGHEFHQRQVGKRANFSLIYGVGWATFQHDTEKQTGIKLTAAEAKRIVTEWNALYPEFKAIAVRAERVAQKRRYVRLMDGRQRWFQPYDHDLHLAFNAVIQGSISQFVKQWMVNVEGTYDVLLTTHDSLTIEVPSVMAKVAVDVICRLGGQEATQFFGVPMEIEAKRWLTLAERLDGTPSGAVG